MTRAVIEAIVARALPGLRLNSFETLHGGMRNHNVLLRFGRAHAPLVLRTACHKEIALWRAAESELLLPQLVHADETFVIYRYVEGIPFQQLKESGSREEIAEAAFAIGKALAGVRRIAANGAIVPRPLPESGDSHALQRRIGARLIAKWDEFLAQAMPMLRPLYAETSLVHGDFNNRNTILRKTGGRWEVAAILDWEEAFLGSPLWDAARFICYEKEARPCREPHFSRGFQEGGGSLPKDWRRVARVINAVGAMDGLGRAELPEVFVEDLRDLVTRTLGQV